MRSFLAILTSLCLVALPLSAAPNAKGGVLTLSAATATLIPFTTTATCSMLIRNNDTAVIYYGFTSGVTATTGFNIAANGGAVGIPFTYQSASAGTQIWLFSTAGTASNAVRYAATCL